MVGGGTVTWTVGTLAPGATRIFTVTGTAPASGTLVAVVSATSTSVDGRPGNNDGSSPNAIVTTVVDAAPPANQPPVVDDVSMDWIPTARLTGVVPMSDPDAGQVVTASLTTPPAHGTATVGPDGSFEWVPDGRVHRHRHVRRDRLRQRQPEPVRHRHRHDHDRAAPRRRHGHDHRRRPRQRGRRPPTTSATPDLRRS